MTAKNEDDEKPKGRTTMLNITGKQESGMSIIGINVAKEI